MSMCQCECQCVLCVIKAPTTAVGPCGILSAENSPCGSSQFSTGTLVL